MFRTFAYLINILFVPRPARIFTVGNRQSHAISVGPSVHRICVDIDYYTGGLLLHLCRQLIQRCNQAPSRWSWPERSKRNRRGTWFPTISSLCTAARHADRPDNTVCMQVSPLMFSPLMCSQEARQCVCGRCVELVPSVVAHKTWTASRPQMCAFQHLPSRRPPPHQSY